MLTRATVTMVGTSMVGAALAVVLSLGDAPERPLRDEAQVSLALREGQADYERSLSVGRDGMFLDVSSLAWINAFRSDVAGPAGDAPARLEVEAAPSPLTPGARLLRVVVQTRRSGGSPLRDGRLRLDFFGAEVAAWRAPERFEWQRPEASLVVSLDEVPAGAARVLFVEVDPSMRYGAAIGTATFTCTSEGRSSQQQVPLERGHSSLDAASSDFRFFAAVFGSAEHALGTARVQREAVAALLDDSTLGQPAREAFVDRGLPRGLGRVLHGLRTFEGDPRY